MCLFLANFATVMEKELSYNDVVGLGLSDAQVAENRAKHGENVLTPPEKTPLWKLYIEKYSDPIIRILLVAAMLSLALSYFNGEFAEVIGIFLAIFLATTISFYFERDAAKKFDVLTAMEDDEAVKVVRNGNVVEVSKRDVVVGDVVALNVGDEVPADGKLLESTNMQVDESSLTGEPMINKFANGRDNGGTYPSNVVLRSSLVMGGTGHMVVTAVGDETEIGKVARKATEMTQVQTPLNQQLNRLARLISLVGTLVAVLAFVGFLVNDILTDPIWHSDNYLGMAEEVLKFFMMAVTLLVMAVPEGLPMAVTLALALNMRRMLKTNNLVRKMHACETMGAVTVICTDKTGTLTQNKMQVQEMYVATADAALLRTSIAMNSSAELDGDKAIGNPTEGALLLWLRNEGCDYKEIRQSNRIQMQLPFSTENKYMATVADVGEHRWYFLKGAPEVVMRYCDLTNEQRADIGHRLLGYQNKAMRTLAFAAIPMGNDESDIKLDEKSSRLTFLGVAAISDPLRVDVPAAVRQCNDAGIEVKIVTGDTKATAVEIARQVGIWSDTTADSQHITGPEFEALSDKDCLECCRHLVVMSRARPTDKQRLVNMLQSLGEVVAVTGDGTNDAPALNHAHVGLSLGSGTSVAKNASDMTLLDDSFASIVRAVQWGRSLYRNIQRFIFFQLVVNVAALLIVLCGSFIGTTLPLTITQMLWVNLIMDTFAAMALATLPPEDDVMKERPRNQKDFIITRPMGLGIGVVGLTFCVALLAMLYVFSTPSGMSVHDLTVFFTVFVMLQWWNLLNAKTLGTSQSALKGLLKDKGLLIVLGIILFGQWFIVTFGREMFRTEPLSLETWLLLIVCTSPVMLIGELIRLLRRCKS